MLLGAGLSNPILLGCLMGCLNTLAPDHIGTLIALTAGVSSLGRAFFLGCCWGVGHSAGMVLTFIFCIVLHSAVNIEVWENVGNYCAGFLMICIGIYFLTFEETYLEKKQDGSYVATPCSCHDHAAPHQGSLESQDVPATGHASTTEVCEESAPLLRPRVALYGREIKGAILGILHGMCCPSCLLGVGFAGRLTTDTYGPSLVAAFVTVFLLASALGTGTFAVGWTMLATQGANSFLSPRIVYRASCGLCFAVGICWIVANYAGAIHFLDFADHALDH